MSERKTERKVLIWGQKVTTTDGRISSKTYQKDPTSGEKAPTLGQKDTALGKIENQKAAMPNKKAQILGQKAVTSGMKASSSGEKTKPIGKGSKADITVLLKQLEMSTIADQKYADKTTEFVSSKDKEKMTSDKTERKGVNSDDASKVQLYRKTAGLLTNSPRSVPKEGKLGTAEKYSMLNLSDPILDKNKPWIAQEIYIVQVDELGKHASTTRGLTPRSAGGCTARSIFRASGSGSNVDRATGRLWMILKRYLV